MDWQMYAWGTRLAAPLLCAGLAFGGTIQVKQDGSGQATTIQGGIDLAQPGDVVEVHPGVYPESIVLDKEIVVRSVAGMRRTIIDASGTGTQAVVLQGALSPATILEGFAVRGGTSTGIDAGGIAVVFCSPTVRGNAVCSNLGPGLSARGAGTPVFSGNLVVLNTGPGFSNWASSGKIMGNRFLRNQGHGIELANDFPSKIAGNVIAHNDGNGIGGSIPSSGGTLLVANNTIFGNRSGVQLDYFADQVTLRRNIIVRNARHGIDCGNPYSLWPALVENDVWGNRLGSYSGSVSAPSDISTDPLLCAPWDDDYHLRSDSPCILGPNDLIGALRPGC